MASKTQDQQNKEAAEKDAPVSGKATNAGSNLRDEGDERADEATGTPDSAVNPTTGEPSQPPPRDVTIKVRDAQLDVRVEGAEDDDEPKGLSDLSDKDLQAIQRRVLEESAQRGEPDTRLFKDMDTESLLVLYHAVREEVASR